LLLLLLLQTCKIHIETLEKQKKKTEDAVVLTTDAKEFMIHEIKKRITNLRLRTSHTLPDAIVTLQSLVTKTGGRPYLQLPRSSRVKP
jgi:hypothetical protein